MILDLSHPVSNSFPAFPGTPGANIIQQASIKTEGWNAKRIEINSHFSTHIDAPYHMLKDGKMLDDFPNEKFISEGIVLDASGQKEIILSSEQIRKDDIVFLYTGQGEQIHSNNYFINAPVIHPDFANELVKKQISIIGLDAASPDSSPYELHYMFLGKDILIVENLTGLKPLINKRFNCIIAPLKIENADGAPCRVFAIV